MYFNITYLKIKNNKIKQKIIHTLCYIHEYYEIKINCEINISSLYLIRPKKYYYINN